MPCSSRACRLENELTDGSLGTIFRLRERNLSPAASGSRRFLCFHGYSGASLPHGGSSDFIPRHELVQPVRAGGLRHPHASRFRGSRGPLVGNLGKCTRNRQYRNRKREQLHAGVIGSSRAPHHGSDLVIASLPRALPQPGRNRQPANSAFPYTDGSWRNCIGRLDSGKG
jgi:hypothetical protein